MQIDFNNISPDWKGSTRQERRFIQKLLKHEGTGKAIKFFAKHCKILSDYWYWYVLSTLWVNYTGFSDLNLWKQLFSANRPNRPTSLMKVDEYEAYLNLPETVLAYRAHRPGETDWIAYTLTPHIAARFATERGIDRVAQYEIPKAEILALFLRRGEFEILVLSRENIQFVRWIEVVQQPAIIAS